MTRAPGTAVGLPRRATRSYRHRRRRRRDRGTRNTDFDLRELRALRVFVKRECLAHYTDMKKALALARWWRRGGIVGLPARRLCANVVRKLRAGEVAGGAFIHFRQHR